MAFHTYTEAPVGRFVERDTGNYFEYSINEDMMDLGCEWAAEEYPHKVWVGGERIGGDQGFRYAIVKKTVAYIVTDEDENGPVVEKWYLKKNVAYAQQ